MNIAPGRKPGKDNMAEENTDQMHGDTPSSTSEQMIPYTRFKQVLTTNSDLAEKLSRAEVELEAERKRVAELSNDERLKEIQAENMKLKEFEKKYIMDKKQNLTKRITELATHPDFEKFTKVVQLPEAVEGKYSFDAVDPGNVEAILQKIDEYKSIGLFTTEQRNPGGNGQTFRPGVTDELYGYSSPEELLRKAPDKYKEYRKVKGFA